MASHFYYLMAFYSTIGQFHVRESILIDLLIVVVQPLDAVVSHKNVQKTLGNGIYCHIECNGNIRIFKAAL